MSLQQAAQDSEVIPIAPSSGHFWGTGELSMAGLSKVNGFQAGPVESQVGKDQRPW